MATRTKLLSWRNINTDSDFSKYIETVSEPWVIEWLEVSENSVWIWKCWVPCERTNWETIYSLVENFSALTIDTSWTGYVIVEIGQTYIDDWSLINEDWTWVAIIKVVSSLPLKNYLELASIESWVITDSRNMIKKVWELNDIIEWLTSYVESIDERVKELEESWEIDHLEDKGIVWELYTASNNLFTQKEPSLANSIVDDCHIWDSSNNKEIHIQRITSWETSDKIKLKVKKNWNPTANLKLVVMKWIEVDSWNEAYWYWDSSNILAESSVASSSITTSYQEIEFTLDNAIIEEKWTLIDIVLYQESWWEKITDSANYYIIASDSTQWSEAFRFVAVNWETRTKSYLMPYCSSVAFLSSLICKVKTIKTIYTKTIYAYNNSDCNTYFNAKNTTNVNLKLINDYTWIWQIRLSWKLRDSWNWWTYTEFTYSWDIVETSHNFWNTSTFSMVAKINWTWSARLKWTKYNGYDWYDSYINAYYDFQLDWTSEDDIKWPARTLWLIWEKWTYTSYWRHIDWSRVRN